MNRKELVKFFLGSFKEWLKDNVPIRAAGLTFFIILPLPSLLLIVISIFALFYGQTQATQQLLQQISSFAGPEIAGLFKQLLAGAMSPFSSAWAAITIVGFSLGGAIGAFAIIRDTMNVIWEVNLPKTKKLSDRVKETIGPFLLVSSLGLIVIAWTITSAALFTAIRIYSIDRTLTLISLTAAQIMLSFALSTLLFALIYKTLPDRKVHWEDVALPSILAGVAFTVVNYILGFYVQTFKVTTIAGAAGSLMIILLWIYILNHIVLFGAVISKVYTTTLGPHPQSHLIMETEKIFEPLERVGGEIESAAKGPIEVGTEEKAQTTTLKEQPTQPSVAISEKGEPPENEETEGGTVEVNVVIKTGRKKRKSGNQDSPPN